jgi:hypothetical protein
MIAAPRPNDHRNPAILPNVFGTENSDSRIAALKGGWRTRFSPDLYTNLIGIALDFTSPPRPLDQAVSNPSRSTDGNGGPPIRLPTGSDCGFDPCYPSHPVRLSSARSTKCQQGGKSAVFATVSVSVFAFAAFGPLQTLRLAAYRPTLVIQHWAFSLPRLRLYKSAMSATSAFPLIVTK